MSSWVLAVFLPGHTQACISQEPSPHLQQLFHSSPSVLLLGRARGTGGRRSPVEMGSGAWCAPESVFTLGVRERVGAESSSYSAPHPSVPGLAQVRLCLLTYMLVGKQPDARLLAQGCGHLWQPLAWPRPPFQVGWGGEWQRPVWQHLGKVNKEILKVRGT